MSNGLSLVSKYERADKPWLARDNNLSTLEAKGHGTAIDINGNTGVLVPQGVVEELEVDWLREQAPAIMRAFGFDVWRWQRMPTIDYNQGLEAALLQGVPLLATHLTDEVELGRERRKVVEGWLEKIDLGGRVYVQQKTLNRTLAQHVRQYGLYAIIGDKAGELYESHSGRIKIINGREERYAFRAHSSVRELREQHERLIDKTITRQQESVKVQLARETHVLDEKIRAIEQKRNYSVNVRKEGGYNREYYHAVYIQLSPFIIAHEGRHYYFDSCTGKYKIRRMGNRLQITTKARIAKPEGYIHPFSISKNHFCYHDYTGTRWKKENVKYGEWMEVKAENINEIIRRICIPAREFITTMHSGLTTKHLKNYFKRLRERPLVTPTGTKERIYEVRNI